MNACRNATNSSSSMIAITIMSGNTASPRKLLPKVKLEIAVPTDVVEPVVEALQRTANTGKIGDGKVFVMDLEQALRIRTGERDAAAIAG